MKQTGLTAVITAVILFIAIPPVKVPGVGETEPVPFTNNGQPFFPIGLYHCPGSDCTSCPELEEISQAGFNCIRIDIGSVTTDLLDRAVSHGVGIFAAAGSWLGNLAAYQENLETKVSQIKNHPALVAYETADEPYWVHYHFGGGYSRENLTAGREFINGLDPNHPVWCNFAPYDQTTVAGDKPLTYDGYVEWTSLGNIFAMDRYPVRHNDYPDDNLNLVNYDCDIIRQIAADGAGEGTTIYMVLQGVGMLEWDGEPGNDGRRPNYTETRFMGYTSIIHGAKGILYWGQSYIEPDSQLWQDLKQFAGELSFLQDVLAAGTTSNQFSISDNDCEAIMKIHNNRRYLIVANASSQPKNNVAITVDQWNSWLAKVLFENRTIDSHTGIIIDSFVPWGVHVYREMAPADFDGNERVDITDFSKLTANWLFPFSGCWEEALDAHWKFDELSGIGAGDSSGSYNGTLVNFPADDSQWVSGRLNGALEFDGLDDYVNIDGYKGITGTASRTVTAWIKLDAGGAVIAMWGQNFPGWSWTLLVNRDGKLILDVCRGRMTGTRPLDDGWWHHVAAVFREDNSPDVNDVQLYVDGTVEQISRCNGCAMDTAADQDVRIGGAPDISSSFYTDGLIDDFHIYARALYETEIACLMDTGCSIYFPRGDLNNDVYLNLVDFAIFADSWLD